MSAMLNVSTAALHPEWPSMSWLRIDDGFASNKKIGALTDRELRVWLRLICWCGKEQDPTVDAIAISEVKGLTSQRVARFVELELLDRAGGVFEVHDWVYYQPKDATGAERQARWRSRRNASVTATVTKLPGTESLPRARAGADTSPVPSLGEAKASPVERPRDELWDALAVEMGSQPSTKSERGRWNRAVRELRDAGAAADDIKSRAREYRRRWPDVSLTVSALAANWGSLQVKRAPAAICPECGIGGNQHAADCPVVAPLTEVEAQNLAVEMAKHR